MKQNLANEIDLEIELSKYISKNFSDDNRKLNSFSQENKFPNIEQISLKNDDQNKFLNQELTIDNIDNYYVRTSILKSIEVNLSGIKGVFLDLGCGEMPYRELIKSISQIDKYIGLDIENPTYQKNNKPDIYWDGAKIPMEDNSVDTVMATELFEHVPSIQTVLTEAYRILKPGGMIFMTIPFLWPLHDVPYDEYRYTPFSLKRHLESSKFTKISINALGGWNASLASMLGLWLKRSPMNSDERATLIKQFFPFYRHLLKKEKQSGELSYLDMLERSNMITGLCATSFKIEDEKPDLNSKNEIQINVKTKQQFLEWDKTAIPEKIKSIVTMLSLEERKFLYKVGKDYWKGLGAIIDAGVFLGGSTLSLAMGIAENINSSKKTKVIHSYDLFRADQHMIKTYLNKFDHYAVGESVRSIFDNNTAEFKDLLEVHEGDLTSFPWTGDDIEILFIDIAKTWELNDYVINEFFPFLIPNHSIIIQQDLVHPTCPWLAITMEYFSDYFEILNHIPSNTMVFKLIKKIPASHISKNIITNLSLEEKLRLMDKALTRYEKFLGKEFLVELECARAILNLWLVGENKAQELLIEIKNNYINIPSSGLAINWVERFMQSKLKNIQEYTREIINSSTEQNLSIIELLELSEDYIKQGDYEKGEEALLNLLTQNPTNTDALNNLVVSKYSQGKIKESEFLLKLIIELQPKNEIAIENLKAIQNIIE